MNAGLLVTQALAAVVDIAFPLLLAIWIARRFRVSWKFFGYGALVFLIFQLLTRVPAMQVLQYLLAEPLQQNAWYKYAFLLGAAFTAGLFEEGGRYLGYRYFWKKERPIYSQALMYGAGHGGLESMLLVGGLALLGVMNIVILTQMDPSILPPDQALAIYQAREELAITAWWLPLLGALERLMAMAVQISLSVLVLQVFARGQGYWWWLALGYHFLVDLIAVLAQDLASAALPQEAALLVTEATIVPLALFSLWLIWRLRPRESETPRLAEPSSNLSEKTS